MKYVAGVLMLLAMPAFAGWDFSPAVEVGAVKGKKVFHHLESANRRGLASSAGRIALVWEDNRTGDPRCWLAVREKKAEGFSVPQALSKGECYEPAVQGVGDGRFVTAWEEGGAVWVSLAGKGKALKLSKAEAAQVTLTKAGGRTLYAAWSEQAGEYKRIMIARLSLDTDGLRIVHIVPVEDAAPADDQAYPALAVNADGSLVAVWEDRRNKHTMILAAQSPNGRQFARPYRLIDVPQVRTIDLGAGMGSMRPSVTSCGASCMVATWLDKRDFLSGYDVFGAFSLNGGGAFTRNLKVQDSFGDNIAQWHAAVAASQNGRVVVAWDDERDGTADVWLSDWNGSEFSDDQAVPGASGPGVQSDPVIHLDAADTLHLAWLERTKTGGTRLKYASAVWKE